MDNLSFYEEAHLIASAIRIIEQKNKKTATYEDISLLLDITTEHTSILCVKLKDLGILDFIKGAFGKTGVILKDHLKIEPLPRKIEKVNMAAEIEKFQTKATSELENKIKSFKTTQKEKEKKLFSDIESKLKQELNK